MTDGGEMLDIMGRPADGEGFAGCIRSWPSLNSEQRSGMIRVML